MLPQKKILETDREGEHWEAMMASIREAAKILNIDLTEKDMPEYMNWFVGRPMHRDLWARVYAKAGKTRGDYV